MKIIENFEIKTTVLNTVKDLMNIVCTHDSHYCKNSDTTQKTQLLLISYLRFKTDTTIQICIRLLFCFDRNMLNDIVPNNTW